MWPVCVCGYILVYIHTCIILRPGHVHKYLYCGCVKWQSGGTKGKICCTITHEWCGKQNSLLVKGCWNKERIVYILEFFLLLRSCSLLYGCLWQRLGQMSNRSYLNQRITRDFLCVMTILAHKGHTQTHRDAHTSFGFTLEMLLLHVCVFWCLCLLGYWVNVRLLLPESNQNAKFKTHRHGPDNHLC